LKSRRKRRGHYQKYIQNEVLLVPSSHLEAWVANIYVYNKTFPDGTKNLYGIVSIPTSILRHLAEKHGVNFKAGTKHRMLIALTPNFKEMENQAMTVCPRCKYHTLVQDHDDLTLLKCPACGAKFKVREVTSA